MRLPIQQDDLVWSPKIAPFLRSKVRKKCMIDRLDETEMRTWDLQAIHRNGKNVSLFLKIIVDSRFTTKWRNRGFSSPDPRVFVDRLVEGLADIAVLLASTGTDH